MIDIYEEVLSFFLSFFPWFSVGRFYLLQMYAVDSDFLHLQVAKIETFSSQIHRTKTFGNVTSEICD